MISTLVERFHLARHDVSRFSYRKLVLDQYIRENVTREEAEQAAATWVLAGPDVSAKIRRVIGYFSLNGFNLAKKQTLC